MRRNPDAVARSMHSQRNVCYQKLFSLVSSQDMFGESFTMKLESDSDSIKTVFGSLCSIILLMVTLFYAYLKLDVLMEKKDVNVLSTVKDLYFDNNDKFHYSDGLNIAVAFTAYDSVAEPILDPTIGELVLNHFSWGYDADGKPFTKREPLP